MTTTSENLLHEIYNEILDVDKLLSEVLGKDIKICVQLVDDWNDIRKIYVDKIKNKEKIDMMDESDIICKLNKNVKKEESNEFEDLLEIGG